MGQAKIQVGDRFGRLIALNATGESRHKRPVWLCQCDCGKTTEVVSGSLLRTDGTRSCGCLSREVLKADRPHKDLIGLRFNYLVVQSKAEHKINSSYAWVCVCDCGEVVTLPGGGLNSGHTKSCGCLNKKAVSEATSSKISGQRFGRLLAVERVGSNAAGAAIWRCICDCGKEKTAPAVTLNSGNLISCGCALLDQPGLRSAFIRNKWAAYGNNRRALKRSAGGKFTGEQVNDLYKKQRGMCANCGVKLGDKFHRDHKVALSDGGTNDILNMELLCKPCNLRKHAKDPIDWANQNGRLC